METSSAEMGSSATTKSGSAARARAMPKRGLKPTVCISSRTRDSRSRRPRASANVSIGSLMICETVMRGFSEAYGSWKIIWRWRRRPRSCPLERRARSPPRNITCPPVGSVRRRTARPSVDLPQPDSPTRPRVSPGKMSIETPSTALTTRRTGEPPTSLSQAVPPPRSKCTFNSRIEISGSRPSPGAAACGVECPVCPTPLNVISPHLLATDSPTDQLVRDTRKG